MGSACWNKENHIYVVSYLRTIDNPSSEPQISVFDSKKIAKLWFKYYKERADKEPNHYGGVWIDEVSFRYDSPYTTSHNDNLHPLTCNICKSLINPNTLRCTGCGKAYRIEAAND